MQVVQLYTVQTPSTGELVTTSIVEDRHRGQTRPGLLFSELLIVASPLPGQKVSFATRRSAAGIQFLTVVAAPIRGNRRRRVDDHLMHDAYRLTGRVNQIRCLVVTATTFGTSGNTHSKVS